MGATAPHWSMKPTAHAMAASEPVPDMHNGQFDTLNDIITFYRDTSTLARAGTLRNRAPELQGIALTAGDATALVAFLRALNEDYL